MTMTLADALALADHASPLPHLAGEALRVLRAELERRPAVPPGWKLVPVEPTREMLEKTSWPGCAATDYKHMLAAAPELPEMRGVVEDVLDASPSPPAPVIDDAIVKRAELIDWHVQVATDPAVNGGLSLQPAQQQGQAVAWVREWQGSGPQRGFHIREAARLHNNRVIAYLGDQADCAQVDRLIEAHNQCVAPAPSEQSDAWREGWARAYAGSDLYTDDGELQDNRMQPFIDFRRDSAETIRQKIVERAQQGQAARKMKGGTHG